MYNQERVEEVIADLIHGENPAGYYRSKEFFDAIRYEAIQKVQAILYTINSRQIHAETTGQIFHLQDWINQPHERTGFNLMEYCMVAGLENLALRIAILGGHSDNQEHLRNFLESFTGKQKVDNLMQRTLNHVDFGTREAMAGNTTIPLSKRKKFKRFVKNHKFALLLVAGGVACTIAAPFTAGVSEILYAVGVSATISSVGAFQATGALRTSLDHVEDQSRVWYEAGEIKNLMNIARKTRIKIEEQVEKYETDANYDLTDEEPQLLPLESANDSEVRRRPQIQRSNGFRHLI